MLSENEIVSIDDIIQTYNLSPNSALTYGIYIKENPLLLEEEKQAIQEYMKKLIKKENNINKINLAYLEQQQQ